MAIQKGGCVLCGKRVNARGLCDTHYKQHKRAGTLPERTKTTHLEINDRLKHLSIVDYNTGCHNWRGLLNPSGYGIIGYHGKWLAHRLSYTLKYGEIPKGINVCHKCDNPKCINTEHLFLGTQADNIHDMISKKRNIVGADCGKSLLTDDDVGKIRNDTRVQSIIAKEYGVSRTNISAIKTGRAWKHVNGKLSEKHTKKVLTEDDVRMIRLDNRVHHIIASEYGVSRSNISAVKSNKSFKNML